ncbi:hypothetical protein WMY93_024375 [Mugilogobius chulae]|uniref:Uncharacterized protein n=1 Tax=Mugilogobius chulae TaxID=88201 RepID=A0AAW0N9T7_9GOBI
MLEHLVRKLPAHDLIQSHRRNPRRNTPENTPGEHPRRTPQEDIPGGHPRRTPQEDTPGEHSRRTPQEDTPGGHPRRTPQENTPGEHPRRTPQENTPGEHPNQMGWRAKDLSLTEPKATRLHQFSTQAQDIDSGTSSALVGPVQASETNCYMFNTPVLSRSCCEQRHSQAQGHSGPAASRRTLKRSGHEAVLLARPEELNATGTNMSRYLSLTAAHTSMLTTVTERSCCERRTLTQPGTVWRHGMLRAIADANNVLRAVCTDVGPETKIKSRDTERICCKPEDTHCSERSC